MKCFLAANSAEGFVSEFGGCYDPADGWRTYIIKGGPGTGKSSFMRKALRYAEERGLKSVEVYCASDPNSLDGVIFPSLKTVIMDGTSPHIVEPTMPGVCDSILDFGRFWDEKRLSLKRSEIISASRENKRLHRSASRYITAAGQLFYEFLELSFNNTDTKTALKRGEYIINRYIPENIGKGRVWNAFLGGVTPRGIIYFEEDVKAERTVVIDDSFGASSEIILDTIRDTTVKRGYETVVFKNTILPTRLTDGLFIPELSLFIYKKHRLIDDPIADELLKRASEKIQKAKLIHDGLESHYIAAMDFEALSSFGETVLKEIF